MRIRINVCMMISLNIRITIITIIWARQRHSMCSRVIRSICYVRC